MTKYSQLLARKAPTIRPVGFEPKAINERLFPFQRAAVRWALKLGRAAMFEACGLGKSAQQLEWAHQVAMHTGRRVLVFAPLAVSSQTIREGHKFGIDVAYARDQSEVREQITVTNYERVDRFDPAAFVGVVLDEGGVLKNYSGKLRRALQSAFERTPYRLTCTATPSPNDHLELGTQAEWLGIMSSHQMIARWFINDTSTFGTYRLKGHAARHFWSWVANWAACISRPSDFGDFSDEGYELPQLTQACHYVDVDILNGKAEGDLFRIPDMSATSVHRERRLTAVPRAARIAELVHDEPSEPWIVWCDSNYEADALVAAIGECIEVRGNQSVEEKEELLGAFTSGQARVLVTKPKIAGYGLNWQHCARAAFVGPTFSFEQHYQAVRRIWRFGQRRPVHVHTTMGHAERAVHDVLLRKARAHDQMQAAMQDAMRRARVAVNRDDYAPKKRMTLPAWVHEEAS